MFEEKFINKMKDKLLKDKQELTEELKKFTKQNIHNKDDYKSDFPDFGDEADENAKETAAFEERLSVEATLEKELRDVKKALERIDKGEHGVCHNCGQEIPKARLEARPTALTCIKCKQELKSKK